MISFRHKGKFTSTEKLLKKSLGKDYLNILHDYGKQGVSLLASNTPKDSGKTSESWSYEIKSVKGSVSIIWKNLNINNGVNIAVILQYGHGTRNGGYVQGIDYINPSLKPIFDKLADSVWKEVTGK